FQNQKAEASQSYVALIGDEVVGFYTLVVAQVEYDDAPQRLGKGIAKHPIPLMLLARLAVATSRQGQGLGSGLLKDAMLRTLQAADIAGIRGRIRRGIMELVPRQQHFQVIVSFVGRRIVGNGPAISLVLAGEDFA
ncbi:MAG: GNAT family N-acetyltransferase, partial [Pirellulales bacterium]